MLAGLSRTIESNSDIIYVSSFVTRHQSSPSPHLHDKLWFNTPYLTKGPTCQTPTIPYLNYHHANNPTISTLPATTPFPLPSSLSIYLPLRLNHNEIHRQPHNPQHRTHTRRNNTRLRIPPSPVLLTIHTQYIPRCRLMLEILTWSSTGVRSPSVWATAIYLRGAVGVGDEVSGKRGEGYGVDYLGRFGDFVVG